MNTNQTQIVVGVDGRPQTAQVVAWATKEATLRRATIVLVHAVGDEVAGHLDGATGHVGEDIGAVISQASFDGQRLVDRARAEIRALAPNVVVEESLSLSTATTALRNLVTGTVVPNGSIVVVGSRSDRDGRSTLDGLEEQVGALGCQLVEVTGASSAGRVLAISDGTVWAMPVLDAAFEVAALRGLPLTVVHVPEESADPTLRSFLRTVLGDQVHELLDCYPTADVELVTEPADVRDVLAGAATTMAYVVADTEHLDELPRTSVRILVPTEPRPAEQAPATTPDDGCYDNEFDASFAAELGLDLPVTPPDDQPEPRPVVRAGDLAAELESWWQLPAAEPAPKPALVRVRRRHLRRFGTEA
ncbi:universal stress protein [Nocardioides sp.]|uniref:universal stress protein n=1 Tax=Nocardioides sp. TaxID=35761 RepID=UPI0037837420